MALEHIVDLDFLVEHWARQRIGHDYVIEKVDTSKLEIIQRATTYSGGAEWWRNETMLEEYYDNDSEYDTTWHFSHTEKSFRSFASWSIIKAFKSSKFLQLPINLEFPSAPVGTEPLSVTFDTALLDQEVRKSTEMTSQWSTSRDIIVEPYGSVNACAGIRTCCLDNVPFMTEIHMFGSIKVKGHKRNRKLSKHEVTVSIADVLAESERHGFTTSECSTDPATSGRFVIFRIEGMCNGVVATEAFVTSKEINSLV